MYILIRDFLAGCRSSHARLRRLLVRACLISPDASPSSIAAMNEHDLILNGFIVGHSAAAA